MPRMRLHWAHMMTVNCCASFGVSTRIAPQDMHSSLPLKSSFGTQPCQRAIILLSLLVGNWSEYPEKNVSGGSDKRHRANSPRAPSVYLAADLKAHRQGMTDGNEQS